MSKTTASTEQRLIRIEEIVTRLEWRLEQKDSSLPRHSNDYKRFCLENNIDFTFFSTIDAVEEYIDKDYLLKIEEWFQENKDNSSITFNQLESQLGGKSSRLKLVKALKAFYLYGFWTDIIETITGESSGCPAEAKSIVVDPFKQEKQ